MRITEAGETAQRLRILAALAEDPGSVLGTYMVAHNHPQFQIQEIQGLPLISSDHQMQAKLSYTLNK